jgi:DNA repair exonuclease SbcCD ATPase subunit
MKIDALALHATNGWPELGTDALAPGLNVFHGGSASGKTTLADLATHAIYGRRFTLKNSNGEHSAAPQGEVIIEHRGKQYRLRRSYDATAGERLTVAALDQSAVDQETVQHLVACISPMILRPLFAVSFRESPSLDWLLSPEFSQEFRDTMWRLQWAPPTVEAELRPIYARLRALETQVASLVRGLGTDESRAAADAKARSRIRSRRASHFLARLTDGALVRLRIGREAGDADVVTDSGNTIHVESLWSTQRDQVYLSLCLALVSALGRHGVRLPLVLDEPFARMDAKASAALVSTLNDFCARRHQVLVFTAQTEATERSAALGAKVHTMEGLRLWHNTQAAPMAADVTPRRVRRRVKTVRREQREAG